jgi:uroporphyrinogen decarboxylase
VRQLSDLEDLHLPDAADDARYSGFAEDVAYFRGRGEFTYGNINGFFSGLHYFLMGYEDVLMAFHVEQDLVRELLRLLGEWNLTAAQKMLEAGVDCIALCDDLGTGESMLISPDTYREFIKPWHTKLNRLVHSYEGRYTHLHSHGNINAVLPDLVEAGFDILNPLDPGDNMNVVDVKARFGATLTLAGGLDKMFFNWPADRCREHLANLVLACGGRGYMLMESSGVSDDVTSEDWQEFLGVSREVRRLNH